MSTKEIASAVKEQLNLDIDKKKMVLADSIKALGTYEVTVKLHAKVTGTLRGKGDGGLSPLLYAGKAGKPDVWPADR